MFEESGTLGAVALRAVRMASSKRGPSLESEVETMKFKKSMIALAVAVAGNLAGIQGVSSTTSTPACITRFDEATLLIENLAGTINPAFEIDETLFAMAFDPEAVVDFVTGSIGYEPYAGTLKGAIGTLSARSGNALDQSLLLATLLNDAGAEARIARATLENEAAMALAAASLDEVIQPPLSLEPQRFKAAASAMARQVGADDIPEIDSDVAPMSPIAPAVTIAERLQDRFDLQPQQDALMAALTDYFFVEWRIGPGDPWVQAHPAFGSSSVPAPIEAREYFGSSIPQALQHRLRFEVGIETLEGKRLIRKAITTPWERPTSNFFDASITWGILPLDRQVEGSDDPTRLFIPTFGGQLAPGAQAFNMLGQTLDPQDAAMPAAGVIAEVGRGFLDAATAVTDDPDGQPLMALTGQFIRVSWIRPDGSTRTEERWFVDRLANRGSEDDPRIDPQSSIAEVTDDLFFQRTYLVQPAGLHLPWTVKRSLEANASRLKWSSDMLRMMDWDTAQIDLNPAAAESWSNDHPLLLQLASLVHHPIDLGEGEAIWRDGPFVVALHQSYRGTEELTQWLDINFNPWRGLETDGESLESRPDLSVLRGVLDTFWEGVVAGKPEMYRGALGERILDPINRRQRLDLEQGFLLAASQSDREQPMWWRIHPVTGEVLGMQTIGGGIEFEEYVGALMIGISGFLIARSMWNCGEIMDDSERRCCYAVAVVFGLSSGAGIGASLLASPIGMSVGAAVAMGALQLNAMLTLDAAQGLATEAACN